MSNCLEEVHVDFDRGETLALWQGAVQCGANCCIEKCADKTAADSADGVVGGLDGHKGEHRLAGLNTHKFELHQLLDRRVGSEWFMIASTYSQPSIDAAMAAVGAGSRQVTTRDF